jgi:hypothetical protein
MKKLTLRDLQLRALMAADLLIEGKVTRIETFRMEMDTCLGENTGN